jgi:NAD(P)-dependent dehydrogenase (short-subunit alcohol dehydrogenase family)
VQGKVLIVTGAAGIGAKTARSASPGLHEFVRGQQLQNSGMIDVAELVRTALFLLGEGSRSITGEVLTVDVGGRFSSG